MNSRIHHRDDDSPKLRPALSRMNSVQNTLCCFNIHLTSPFQELWECSYSVYSQRYRLDERDTVTLLPVYGLSRLLFIGYLGLTIWKQSDRDLKLKIHFHLILKLRISGAMLILPICPHDLHVRPYAV
jgi:hypothetical protein